MGRLIINAMNHATPLLVQAAQTAGEIKPVSSRASSLTYGMAKHAHFSYQDKTVYLNTQFCLDLPLLIQRVKEWFQIDEQSVVNIYMKLADGTLSQIIHISGIVAKERYYVKTVADALKKIQSIPEMEEFFVKLESTLKNPIKKERQMKQVRDAFDGQDIEYDQLVATGELAMTDGELKKIGIIQGGLRTAILAVIKSNILL